MKQALFTCLLLIVCGPVLADKNIKSQQLPETLQGINSKLSAGRWYTQAQVQSGKQVYQLNCLVCHKENALGTEQWKETLPGGDYPPPPLNGSAHAWHHDIDTLTRYIKNGGVSLGGVMPGFKNKLSEKKIFEVIAYFQSYWSDEIYNDWLEISGFDVGPG